MIENIALWGGVAGCVAAFFAIIILFLTRQSILSILNKDKILFDESFHMKKEAISSACALIDKLEQNGNALKNDLTFVQEAKKSYNDLLCVLSDVRIADEFYNITVDLSTPFNTARFAHFKLMCRKDIGLKIRKAQTVKRVLANKMTENVQPQAFVQPQAPVHPQMQQVPVQQIPQPQVQQSQQGYVQSQPRPVNPVQPTYAQQQYRPTVQPQPRPAPQPQQVRSTPETEQIKRVGRPKNS